MFETTVCKIASGAAVIMLTALAAATGQDVGQPINSQSRTVKLSSGTEVESQYFFARNALTQARSINGSIIALTASGNILEFDRFTLGPKREWYYQKSATCLGQTADGSLLAGFEDGRVCAIDAARFTSKELARVPGRPQWVTEIRHALPGRLRASVLAVCDVSAAMTPATGVDPLPKSLIYSTADESRYVLPSRASAFLLDSKERLWLGADNGEWGGWCSCFDTRTRRLSSIPGLQIFQSSKQRFWRGVLGFAEVDDEQVWAFGGIVHFSDSEGFIWRVDSGTAEELYRSRRKSSDTVQKRLAAGKRVISPRLPIAHVHSDKRSTTVTVITLTDAFTTTRSFSIWTKIASIPARIGPNRIDSGGPAAPVKQVLRVGKKNEAEDLILITSADGLIDLSDGTATSHAIPREIGVNRISRIENSCAGVLVFGVPPEPVGPWQYKDGGWNSRDFSPPLGTSVGDGAPILRAMKPLWEETQTLVGPNGDIITVSASSTIPGGRTTARWSNNRLDALGTDTSGINLPGSFVTPDGSLWNVSDSRLSRFRTGRWIPLPDSEWPQPAGRKPLDGAVKLRSTDASGPPWIIFDPQNERLVRLSVGRAADDVHAEIISVKEGADDLGIWDVAKSGNGEQLLLATNRGLRTLAPSTLKFESSGLDVGDREVRRLCRDGLGRLWVAGTGLALIHPGRNRAEQLDDALPMVGDQKIVAISRDPARPGGVFAAIQGRGVVAVQATGTSTRNR